MESQNIPIAKAILREKENWEVSRPDFKLYYKFSNQNNMVISTKKQTHKSMK